MLTVMLSIYMAPYTQHMSGLHIAESMLNILSIYLTPLCQQLNKQLSQNRFIPSICLAPCILTAQHIWSKSKQKSGLSICLVPHTQYIWTRCSHRALLELVVVTQLMEYSDYGNLSNICHDLSVVGKHGCRCCHCCTSEIPAPLITDAVKNL